MRLFKVIARTGIETLKVLWRLIVKAVVHINNSPYCDICKSNVQVSSDGVGLMMCHKCHGHFNEHEKQKRRDEINADNVKRTGKGWRQPVVETLKDA